MPAHFTFGAGLRLPAAFRGVEDVPVVLVCDGCGRIQDGLADDASEAKWTERGAYFAAHGLSYGDVWWCHTTCRRGDVVTRPVDRHGAA